MARRDWYCEDVISGKIEVERVNAAAEGVTPHMHWHIRGPGIP